MLDQQQQQRRSSGRKRERVDYAGLECGADLVNSLESFASNTSKWVAEVKEREFVDAEDGNVVQYFDNGRLCTPEWARRTGLCRPTVIRHPEGLGLTVPKGITVKEIAKLAGEKTPIQVMRVSDQSEIPNWSFGDWSNYWYSSKRTESLNVISFEFSKVSALAKRVKSPWLVRNLDWIDTAWPGTLKSRGEYPQTQYYCLMSTKDSYTDFHVDFGGTAVWYHVLSGKKTFLLVAPTPERLEKYERWISDSFQDETFFPDLVERDAVVRLDLRAGQTLVIPSAWLHAVHTPEDSVVFGGNFLPGLCTARLQLAVYDIERRAKIPDKFRFPFFPSAMFFGLAHTLLNRRFYGEEDREKDIDDNNKPLTPSEEDGLFAILEACERWTNHAYANNDASRERNDYLFADHMRIAAKMAGCEGGAEEVRDSERAISPQQHLIATLRDRLLAARRHRSQKNDTTAAAVDMSAQISPSSNREEKDDLSHARKKTTVVKISAAWLDHSKIPATTTTTKVSSPPALLEPVSSSRPTVPRQATKTPATTTHHQSAKSRLKAKLDKRLKRR